MPKCPLVALPHFPWLLPCLTPPELPWLFSGRGLSGGCKEGAASPMSPKAGGSQAHRVSAPRFCPAASPLACSPPPPCLTISLYYCNKCSHKSGRYRRARRSLLLSYGNVISSVPGKFYKILSGGIINCISSPFPSLLRTPLPMRRVLREGQRGGGANSRSPWWGCRHGRGLGAPLSATHCFPRATQDLFSLGAAAAGHGRPPLHVLPSISGRCRAAGRPSGSPTQSSGAAPCPLRAPLRPLGLDSD